MSAAASAAAALLLSAPPTAMATSDRTARLKERTARSLLSTASQNAAAPTPAEAPTEFAGREDVDALNEKIKGRKRKSDHMIEHNEEPLTILAEISRINGLIYAAGNHQATIAAQLMQEIQGSMAMKEELKKHYASLQESLKKVECLRSYRDEKEARIVAESSRNELSEELGRTQQKRLNDQLEQKRLNDQSEALKLKNNLLNEVEAPRGQFHEVREDTHHKSAEMNSLLSELGAYKELMRASVSELENVMIQCDALEETCSNQTEMIQKLQNQLASMTSEYESQKKMSEELKLRLAEAEQKNVDGEKLRKKLHNTILELKGNIRVFCRVRPLLSNEPGAISYTSEVDYLGRRVVLNHNTQGYSFAFDKVFDHLASQEDVFTEISQLVQSALDGHKVCIFAYGQTGSGKTHTMIGNPELNDQKGIIPRSFEQIFQTSQCSMSQGWKYNMQASLLEIYNETIRDLLATNHDGAASKYDIKHDTDGNAQVSGLTIVDVQSMIDVSSLLKRAAKRRSVGKTEMNEESSRSHCVFTLRILGVNEGTDQQVQGALNLIDLAGSERVNKSGAIGDRLKETRAINKSLSCLTDVIAAIAKKEEHVPFRNSKLTHLLQPCLGGDCKTLMFVNVSPEVSSTSESICSLRFAARVNSCEIGVPRRQN